MPNYRLYRLHPESGRFIGVDEIDAGDDASAIQEMQARRHGNSVELWDGGRKVIRIDASPNGAAFVSAAEGQALHQRT